jgi:hypothetical protein
MYPRDQAFALRVIVSMFSLKIEGSLCSIETKKSMLGGDEGERAKGSAPGQA